MSIILDGSNGVTFPSGTVEGDAGIGYGQTWQNVTASRVNNTTYTNTTTKPIFVCISGGDGTGYSMTFSIGGIAMYRSAVYATGGVGGAFIIPSGVTYSVNFAGTISYWFELR